MKCERCGTFLLDGTDFCTGCGAPTAHGQFADQQPPVPPPFPQGYPPPQQQVPGGPTSTPSSAGSGTIWVVVGVVVIVSASILLVWLMTSPWSGVEPEPELTTINLASPGVIMRPISDESHWDAVISINKVSPRGERVLWDDTRLVIEASDGRVLHERVALALDEPATYDNGSDGTVSVQFWYVETISGDVDMDGGDGIKITGLTEEYEGATVRLTRHGETIGSVVLPMDFP